MFLNRNLREVNLIRGDKFMLTPQEIQDSITNYLVNGGLFNPELMDHDKVRDLLIQIRDSVGESNV